MLGRRPQRGQDRLADLVHVAGQRAEQAAVGTAVGAEPGGGLGDGAGHDGGPAVVERMGELHLGPHQRDPARGQAVRPAADDYRVHVRVCSTLRIMELCQTLRAWRHCRLVSTQVLLVSTFGAWIPSRWPRAISVAAQNLSSLPCPPRAMAI